MREAEQQNMERRNAIDQYLRSLPGWIEKDCREWIITKETAGIQPPLTRNVDSVQANCIMIYSRVDRPRRSLNENDRNRRANQRFNNIEEEINEYQEQIDELKEKIERLSMSGTIFDGKNGTGRLRGEIIDSNNERYTWEERGRRIFITRYIAF